jgi:high frequency lysogenization protein
MTQYTDQDRTIALCGIYQAARIVHELATEGEAPSPYFEVSIDSLFVENPDSTLDVFGGKVENIQLGVQTLLAQMQSAQALQTRSLEITTYALNLIILERKLAKTEGALENIGKMIDNTRVQRTHFGPYHDNVIASLARIYTENVSNITPRIMVKGRHGHLQNPRTANRIRATLLAGIRAAVLWRQVGGTRINLIFSRKKYLRAAQALYRPDLGKR